VPTSSKTSNALAVKRCMSFKSCLDGVAKNRFQAQKSFLPASVTPNAFYKYSYEQTSDNC
jgi:hypothetical protein